MPKILEQQILVTQGWPFPANWEPFNFRDIERNTGYRLVEEDAQAVIKNVNLETNKKTEKLLSNIPLRT